MKTKCYCGHTTRCDCGPETLEEADERLATASPKIFKEGAKWQQEQILDFLYSEITERRDYSASKMCEKAIEFIEQFKNK